MIKKLAIIGASGHGKVIADVAVSSGVKNIVFYDDRWEELNSIGDYPIVGSVEHAIHSQSESDYQAAIVAIGNSEIRSRIQKQLKRVAPAIIHPSAAVSPSVRIALGSVVMPHAVINADTRLGEGVIINSGAVVEHDCIVGDYSHISPNASLAGGVFVGSHSWIGIGSAVIQLIKIGSHVTVGAGAVVIRDIPDNQTVVGNPAVHIKTKEL